jgi:hypothetical protein
MKLSSLFWQNLIKLPLLVLYGFIGSLNFTSSALASTQQLNLSIRSKENQSFQNLMQEAEALATNSIYQIFQSNYNVTNITVNVIGEHYGQQVPLLSVTVSQANWQKDPQIKSWVKYFSGSERLLGFAETSQPISSSTNSPVTQQRPYLTENEPNFHHHHN